MSTVARIALAVLSVLLVFGLAACGGDTVETPPASEPPVSGGGTTGGDDGAALLQERCDTACHGLERVDAATKDYDGWVLTIDRMITNGANLTPEEKETLARYLAER